MNFDASHLPLELRRHAPEDWAHYRRGCESTMMGTYNNDALELGLCGEAGEVLDTIKKLKYHAHVISREKVLHELKLELGDLLWYMALLGYDGTRLDPIERAHITGIKRLARYAESVDLGMMRRYIEHIMGHYKIDPIEVLCLNRKKLLKRYKAMK